MVQITKHYPAPQLVPDPMLEHTTEPVNMALMMRTYEREIVRWALKETRGNMKDASYLLGTNYSTLSEKIRRLEIDRSEFRETFKIVERP